MLSTLDRKLAAVLLAVTAVLGGVAAALTVTTTRTYTDAALQRLNRDLARQIVDERLLMTGQGIEQAALKQAFHQLMVINPAIEVYLLDPRGQILSYSAPPGRVRRTQVSLEPVTAFLEGDAGLPILGDDPRDPREDGRGKIFSAAPIRTEDRLRGYLYIILAGEQYSSGLDRLVRDRILRVSVGIAVGSALLVLLVAVGLVRLLTRRLRRLTAEMEELGRGGLAEDRGDTDTDSARAARGDEIERLEQGFHRMARRISDQIHELRQMDAHRRELVANVSHDLRTPLAQIQGYLETLVLREERLGAEERREYLGIALRQAERLGRLVAELFELARLDARTRGPDAETFSPAELVQDVVQKFRVEAERRGLDLHAELPPDVPFVHADLGLIERLLDNLIENAFRHTPAGGAVTVSLQSSDGAGTVRVEVADTGEGIAPERIEEIFERFHRGPASKSRADDGAGLGLPIARRIAELHGSTLECHSAVGEGSRFVFTLPAASSSSFFPQARIG